MPPSNDIASIHPTIYGGENRGGQNCCFVGHEYYGGNGEHAASCMFGFPSQQPHTCLGPHAASCLGSHAASCLGFPCSLMLGCPCSLMLGVPMQPRSRLGFPCMQPHAWGSHAASFLGFPCSLMLGVPQQLKQTGVQPPRQAVWHSHRDNFVWYVPAGDDVMMADEWWRDDLDSARRSLSTQV